MRTDGETYGRRFCTKWRVSLEIDFLGGLNIKVSNFATLNPQNTIFGCISGISHAKTCILLGVITLELIKL